MFRETKLTEDFFFNLFNVVETEREREREEKTERENLNSYRFIPKMATTAKVWPN